MARREELLLHLWKDLINLNLREASLDNIMSHCKRNPAAPFGDTGPAIERILAAGASGHGPVPGSSRNRLGGGIRHADLRFQPDPDADARASI